MPAPETTTPETTTPESTWPDENHWELDPYDLTRVLETLVDDLKMHPMNTEGGFADLDQQYGHIIAVGTSIVLLTTALRTHCEEHNRPHG